MIRVKLLLLLIVTVELLNIIYAESDYGKSCYIDSEQSRYIRQNNLSLLCEDLIENTHVEPRLSVTDQCYRIDLNDVLVFTVATNETDGYKRYLRSTEIYGFRDKVKILGFDKPWKGGDVRRSIGGGQKINLFKEALKEYQNDANKIVIFTDSYDVIFSGSLEEIIRQFKEFNARVVFSTEEYCWPDKSLISLYPPVTRGKRYLNSGGFIGYATELYSIVNSAEIDDMDDDQLFYTKVYLDPELREKYNIKLDHKSQIFETLFGSVGDVELRFKGNEAYLQNTLHNTVPLIVHGNGLSKLVLNYLGNYLANAWSQDTGCSSCWDNTIEIPDDNEDAYPIIVMAVFIEKPTPFFEEFLEKLYKLKYPKSKLYLFIHNNVPYHENSITDFLDEHEKEYKGVKKILSSDDLDEISARNLAMDYCILKNCAAYFNVESEAHLDNAHTLKLLVEQQRSIVAPLLVRPYKSWSNFWGAITDDGFYARSSDYMQIINNERRGLWNVPYISTCYLINATLIRNKQTRPSYSHNSLDPEMAFAYHNRDRYIFMYVSNRLTFGHLIKSDNFNTSLTHPDIYQIFDNEIDWEKRYIHENYTKNLDKDNKPMQPCPDVYWFPIVNARFANEFVEIMENYGKWSDGSNTDVRLAGGYENVPTRDIHMNQVNLETQWLYFLRRYVKPLQEMVFTGYFHDDPRLENGYEAVPTRDIHMTQVGLDDAWLQFLKNYVNPLQQRVFDGYYDYPPRSLMNFVVRYKPDEQPSLRPHHDSSTYTINIALNRVGIDYEGGGCRFIRYNCSVTDTKIGWMLMHPGRLTHYHEGLLVTKGTRYIMISFVDP